MILVAILYLLLKHNHFPALFEEKKKVFCMLGKKK